MMKFKTLCLIHFIIHPERHTQSKHKQTYIIYIILEKIDLKKITSSFIQKEKKNHSHETTINNI
jgi:hypothetical protein